MKKMLVLLAGLAMVCSCNNDDDSNQEEEFFNLQEGNMWVYKNYTTNEEGQEAFHGTDTVRVVGMEIVDGQTYHKVTHTNHYVSNNDSEELLRVNEEGHLVNPSGKVVHPGTDDTYQFTRPEYEGSMFYQLQDVANLTIEGHQYTVYPYEGYYTPIEPEGPPAGVGESINYDSNVGVALYRCRFISGPTYLESRLVHYELN